MTCTTDEFTIGGTLSGLSGDPVTVTLNSAQPTEIQMLGNGSFWFATTLTDWTSYTVSVSDTVTHTCEIVAGAAGWVASQQINNVTIECVERPSDFTVWATVSGIEGNGLVLTNDGGSSRNIYGDGTFLIATGLQNGSFFDVTVTSQPTNPVQVCSASSAVSGTIAEADVVVNYSCVTNMPYAITGVVSGYNSDSNAWVGLQIIEETSGLILPISADGVFTFPLELTTGYAYNVTVQQQPQQPAQTCTAIAGAGVIAVADGVVNIYCFPNVYSVAAYISGLHALNDVTLAVGTSAGVVSATVASDGWLQLGDYADLTTYEISIWAQPVTLAQACYVDNGNGQVHAAPVSNIEVFCEDQTFQVFANVVSLAGEHIVVRLGSGAETEDLSVAANGVWPFAADLTGMADFDVGVFAQPTSPAQTCWADPSATPGQLANAGTTVTIWCTNDPVYSLSVTVNGLSGDHVVVREIYSGAITVANSSGTVTLPGTFVPGQIFEIQVDDQPAVPAQTCTFAGSGMPQVGGNFGAADIAVELDCSTNVYSIGAHIVGVAGQGLTLGLSTAAGTSVLGPINNEGSGSFGAYADQTTYFAFVVTQPQAHAQTCTIDNPIGIVDGAPVSDITVTCVDRLFTLYADVVTLATGSELVLRNNGEDIVATTSARWAFPTPLTGGASFDLTVSTQPLAQFCVFPSGSTGTMNDAEATVLVSCGEVGGSLEGVVDNLLSPHQPLKLRENVSGLVTAIYGNGPYEFPLNLTTGNSYDVQILGQPQNPNQICTMSNPTGVVAGPAVTDVNVTCQLAEYAVGGFVSNLNGSGLQVRLDVDGLVTDATVTATPTGNGAFGFGSFDDHSLYVASVVSQPTAPAQTCALQQVNDRLSGSPVSDIEVNCADDLFPIYVQVSGLKGAGLVLQNDGSDDLLVFANGTWPFPTPITGLESYSLTVSHHPEGPAQTCTFAAGAVGTLSDAATTATLACVDDDLHELRVTVTGLTGSGLILLEGYSGVVTNVYHNGTWTYPFMFTAGASYYATVLQPPVGPSQTCEFAPGVSGQSGFMPAGDETLNLACTTDSFVLGGSVSGLYAGNDVTLLVATSQGVTSVNVAENGLFAVGDYVDETTYFVSVATQPTLPGQTCAVANPNGQFYGTPASNVYVQCELNTYPVAISVSGLSGVNLSLIKDGFDSLAIPTLGTWPFAVAVTGTASVTAVVHQQPVHPAQTCSITTPLPITMADAPGFIEVACIDDPLHPLRVNVVDLMGYGLQLLEAYSGQVTNAYTLGNHTLTFTHPFTTGTVITLQVDEQPGAPAQTCLFGNGQATTSATFPNGELVLDLTCTQDLFTIGGSIVGLESPAFTVTMATSSGLSFPVYTANGPFLLGSYVDQTTFVVAIASQPLGQYCSIENWTGIVYGAAISDIEITCETIDSDNDGLTDLAEIHVYNTDPYNPDTDGDGLIDGDEVRLYGTNPLTVDTDGDGAWDSWELWGYCRPGMAAACDLDMQNAASTPTNWWGVTVATDPMRFDTDGDGLSDGFEVAWNSGGQDGSMMVFNYPAIDQVNCTGSGDLHPRLVDTDAGGIWDGAELVAAPGKPISDPLLSCDDPADADNDGISDWDEVNIHGTDPLNPDSDHDGLSDYQELFLFNTDPNVEDTDGDGLLDGEEVWVYGTDPAVYDTDGDGLSDGEEVLTFGTNPITVDTDGDGAWDSWELWGYCRPGMAAACDLDWQNAASTPTNWWGVTVATDPLRIDTDGDGLSDGFEVAWNSGGQDGSMMVFNYPAIDQVNCTGSGDLHPRLVDTDAGGIWDGAELVAAPGKPISNPLLSCDDPADADNDGISDWDEVNIHFTNPLQKDSDFDGLSDYEELFNYFTNPLSTDTDNDGISDFHEVKIYGTNPITRDTDGDGLEDWEEIFVFGTNPLDTDTDDDGISDFDELNGFFGFFTDPRRADSDLDGISDYDEIVGTFGHFTDPNDVDSDDDGLRDGPEIFVHNTDPNVWDSDGDGLGDGHEVTIHGTDPLNADSDGDGLTDYEEIVIYATNPLAIDTDGDGIGDYHEIFSTLTDPLNPDTDGDGLEDGFETSWNYGNRDGNPNFYTPGVDLDPNNMDSDFGGIADGVEVYIDGTNPLDRSDDKIDSDNDGILDFDEIAMGTNPFAQDTDLDGLDDGFELLIGTNPFDPDTDKDGLTDYEEVKIYRTDPLKLDTDGDTLTDGQEVLIYGTNPLKRDSDDDGLTDAEELYLYGTDPLNDDSDFDGLLDGEEVKIYGTNPLHIDSDGDRLPDSVEVFDLGTDPANWDTDGDGISDGDEVLIYGTNPLHADTDGDGISDYQEIFIDGTNPLVSDLAANIGSSGGKTDSCSVAPTRSDVSVYFLQWLILFAIPALYGRRRGHKDKTGKSA